LYNENDKIEANLFSESKNKISAEKINESKLKS